MGPQLLFNLFSFIENLQLHWTSRSSNSSVGRETNVVSVPHSCSVCFCFKMSSSSLTCLQVSCHSVFSHVLILKHKKSFLGCFFVCVVEVTKFRLTLTYAMWSFVLFKYNLFFMQFPYLPVSPRKYHLEVSLTHWN